MKCCIKKMGKIGMVLIVISAMLFSGQPVHAAENMDVYEMGEVITESIKVEEPIREITNGGKSAIYSYTEENLLKTKTIGSVVTNYLWQNNVLIGESSNAGRQIDFEYAVVDGKAMCTNIIVNGKIYSMRYENNNVSEIYEDGTLVCKYEYEAGSTIPIVYEVLGEEKSVNTSSNFIGNINPLRYQGWYWDADINHYYIGDGMFYDAINEIYVQNDYVMQEWGWEILHNAASVFSLTRVQINAIAGEYETLMSQPSYGAASYSNVTEAQWQNGERWYDGVSDVETVARCIFAENTYANRLNDRIGVAAVIINRKTARNLSARGVVTQLWQFATMNPGDYADSNSSSCGDARMAHSKTDTRWQQATLLACIACSVNTSVGTDISYFYNMPSCISNQQYFRGFKSTYNSFSYDGSSIKFASQAICDVAIVDYGYITSDTDLEYVKNNYVSSGYNIFFNYR